MVARQKKFFFFPVKEVRGRRRGRRMAGRSVQDFVKSMCKVTRGGREHALAYIPKSVLYTW